MKIVTQETDLDNRPHQHTSAEAGVEETSGNIKGFGRDVSCVKDLLDYHLRNVYQFQIDDLGAQINGHSPFNELTAPYALANRGDQNDLTHYPDVRSGLGKTIFSACTVRCTRSKCSVGKPVELECEPHAFGKVGSQVSYYFQNLKA